MPFIFLSRVGTKSAVICEPDWVDLVLDQGWKKDVLTYKFEQIGSYTDLIKKIIELLHQILPSNARVGVDDDLWPQALYESVHAKEEFQWIPVAALITDIRMVKTCGEIRQIDEAWPAF